jgi:hypothetical protein
MPALYLARGSAWQAVGYVDHGRHLELGKVFAAMGADRVRVSVSIQNNRGLDDLAVQLIRDPE